MSNQQPSPYRRPVPERVQLSRRKEFDNNGLAKIQHQQLSQNAYNYLSGTNDNRQNDNHSGDLEQRFLDDPNARLLVASTDIFHGTSKKTAGPVKLSAMNIPLDANKGPTSNENTIGFNNNYKNKLHRGSPFSGTHSADKGLSEARMLIRWPTEPAKEIPLLSQTNPTLSTRIETGEKQTLKPQPQSKIHKTKVPPNPELTESLVTPGGSASISDKLLEQYRTQRLREEQETERDTLDINVVVGDIKTGLVRVKKMVEVLEDDSNAPYRDGTFYQDLLKTSHSKEYYMNDATNGSGKESSVEVLQSALQVMMRELANQSNQMHKMKQNEQQLTKRVIDLQSIAKVANGEADELRVQLNKKAVEGPRSGSRVGIDEKRDELNSFSVMGSSIVVKKEDTKKKGESDAIIYNRVASAAFPLLAPSFTSEQQSKPKSLVPQLHKPYHSTTVTPHHGSTLVVRTLPGTLHAMLRKHTKLIGKLSSSILKGNGLSPFGFATVPTKTTAVSSPSNGTRRRSNGMPTGGIASLSINTVSDQVGVMAPSVYFGCVTMAVALEMTTGPLAISESKASSPANSTGKALEKDEQLGANIDALWSKLIPKDNKSADKQAPNNSTPMKFNPRAVIGKNGSDDNQKRAEETQTTCRLGAFTEAIGACCDSLHRQVAQRTTAVITNVTLVAFGVDDFISLKKELEYTSSFTNDTERFLVIYWSSVKRLITQLGGCLLNEDDRELTLKCEGIAVFTTIAAALGFSSRIHQALMWPSMDKNVPHRKPSLRSPPSMDLKGDKDKSTNVTQSPASQGGKRRRQSSFQNYNHPASQATYAAAYSAQQKKRTSGFYKSGDDSEYTVKEMLQGTSEGTDYAHWPSVVDRFHSTQKIYSETGEIVWCGPRMKVGVSRGQLFLHSGLPSYSQRSCRNFALDDEKGAFSRRDQETDDDEEIDENEYSFKGNSLAGALDATDPDEKFCLRYSGNIDLATASQKPSTSPSTAVRASNKKQQKELTALSGNAPTAHAASYLHNDLFVPIETIVPVAETSLDNFSHSVYSGATLDTAVMLARKCPAGLTALSNDVRLFINNAQKSINESNLVSFEDPDSAKKLTENHSLYELLLLQQYLKSDVHSGLAKDGLVDQGTINVMVGGAPTDDLMLQKTSDDLNEKSVNTSKTSPAISNAALIEWLAKFATGNNDENLYASALHPFGKASALLKTLVKDRLSKYESKVASHVLSESGGEAIEDGQSFSFSSPLTLSKSTKITAKKVNSLSVASLSASEVTPGSQITTSIIVSTINEVLLELVRKSSADTESATSEALPLTIPVRYFLHASPFTPMASYKMRCVIARQNALSSSSTGDASVPYIIRGWISGPPGGLPSIESPSAGKTPPFEVIKPVTRPNASGASTYLICIRMTQPLMSDFLFPPDVRQKLFSPFYHNSSIPLPLSLIHNQSQFAMQAGGNPSLARPSGCFYPFVDDHSALFDSFDEINRQRVIADQNRRRVSDERTTSKLPISKPKKQTEPNIVRKKEKSHFEEPDFVMERVSSLPSAKQFVSVVNAIARASVNSLSFDSDASGDMFSDESPEGRMYRRIHFNRILCMSGGSEWSKVVSSVNEQMSQKVNEKMAVEVAASSAMGASATSKRNFQGRFGGPPSSRPGLIQQSGAVRSMGQRNSIILGSPQSLFGSDPTSPHATKTNVAKGLLGLRGVKLRSTAAHHELAESVLHGAVTPGGGMIATYDLADPEPEPLSQEKLEALGLSKLKSQVLVSRLNCLVRDVLSITTTINSSSDSNEQYDRSSPQDSRGKSSLKVLQNILDFAYHDMEEEDDEESNASATPQSTTLDRPSNNLSKSPHSESRSPFAETDTFTPQRRKGSVVGFGRDIISTPGASAMSRMASRRGSGFKTDSVGSPAKPSSRHSSGVGGVLLLPSHAAPKVALADSDSEWVTISTKNPQFVVLLLRELEKLNREQVIHRKMDMNAAFDEEDTTGLNEAKNVFPTYLTDDDDEDDIAVPPLGSDEKGRPLRKDNGKGGIGLFLCHASVTTIATPLVLSSESLNFGNSEQLVPPLPTEETDDDIALKLATYSLANSDIGVHGASTGNKAPPPPSQLFTSFNSHRHQLLTSEMLSCDGAAAQLITGAQALHAQWKSLKINAVSTKDPSGKQKLSSIDIRRRASSVKGLLDTSSSDRHYGSSHAEKLLSELNKKEYQKQHRKLNHWLADRLQVSALVSTQFVIESFNVQDRQAFITINNICQANTLQHPFLLSTQIGTRPEATQLIAPFFAGAATGKKIQKANSACLVFLPSFAEARNAVFASQRRGLQKSESMSPNDLMSHNPLMAEVVQSVSKEIRRTARAIQYFQRAAAVPSLLKPPASDHDVPSLDTMGYLLRPTGHRNKLELFEDEARHEMLMIDMKANGHQRWWNQFHLHESFVSELL